MTVKKIVGIVLIFVFTSIAWMILGVSNMTRTDEAYKSLKREVASLYGGELDIFSPQLVSKEKRIKTVKEDGKRIEKVYYHSEEIKLHSSDVVIDLNLDQRKKGNLWFPTYQATLNAVYEFNIPKTSKKKSYHLLSSLESADSIYRDIEVKLNQYTLKDIGPLISKEEILVYPDKDRKLRVEIKYKSTGMERLKYFISRDHKDLSQVNNFSLIMNTDFENFDFPSGMMSPIEKTKTASGYQLTWQLDQSVTGKDIGIIIPNKLNPGEIVTRVSFFAPVSLLFFFVVLFMLAIVLKLPFHPMHYFFLAATFFSFHLMFSYFSDHLNLHLSFAVAAIISSLLSISYLRLFTDKNIAYFLAPITQILYLNVFSYSFFFKGMTGLIVTICSVLTLFVLMQLTGKTDWEKVFQKKAD